VLSPQVVNDVVYCTIQTSPTGIVASLPVSAVSFKNNASAEELGAFANNIETLVGRGNVIGGTGVQTIDGNGLLKDQVSFTVQYVPAGSGITSITADALVPANLLSVDDPEIDTTLLNEAEAIITKVYNNLKNAAGG
jgi:hypothetical protein